MVCIHSDMVEHVMCVLDFIPKLTLAFDLLNKESTINHLGEHGPDFHDQNFFSIRTIAPPPPDD